MHKWLPLFCCLLVLVGCHQTTIQPQTEQFVCDFTIHTSEDTFSGTLKRENVGTLTVSVESPQTLNGLQAAITRENVRVTLGDLQLTDITLPQAAIPCLLCDVLDAVYYAVIDKTACDGDALQGRIGDTVYQLKADAKTGTLQSVHFPKEDIECIFTNIQLLD